MSRCLEGKLSKKTSQLVDLTAHNLQTADSVMLVVTVSQYTLKIHKE